MSFSNRLENILECQQGIVRSIRFSVDGNYCLTSGSDKTIILWNPYKNLKIKTYEGQSYESLDVRGSNDNGKIACCGLDKLVKIIDVATGKNVRKFKGHAGLIYKFLKTGRVNCISFNDDSSVILSGSIDGTVRVWDLKSNINVEVQILKDAKDSVTKICLSNYEIFTASADGYVRRYDLRNGRAEADCVSLKGVSSIDITNKTDRKGENFKCVLITTLEGHNFLLDTQDGSRLADYNVPTETNSIPKPCSLFQIDNCLSQDDETVFVGSEESCVYCWDLLESNLKCKLEHPTNDGTKKDGKLVVSSLSSHPNKNIILTAAGTCGYLWLPENQDS